MQYPKRVLLFKFKGKTKPTMGYFDKNGFINLLTLWFCLKKNAFDKLYKRNTHIENGL